MRSNFNSAEPMAPSAAKLRPVSDFYAGLFDLVNDDITGPEWQAMLSHYADCQASRCIWWPAGRPDEYTEEAYGDLAVVSAADRNYLEAIVAIAQPEQADLVDSWAHTARAELAGEITAVLSPQRMVACIAWTPARVFIVLEGPRSQPTWQDADRQRLLDVLPILGKAIAIRKKLNSGLAAIELADQVFDEIPRAFIALTPDGVILHADRIANKLMADETILQRKGDQLVLPDKQTHQKYLDALAAIKVSPKNAVGELVWNARLTHDADAETYAVMLKGFPFMSWRSVSDQPHDRMALLVLQSPSMEAPADPYQISAAFGLTPAQARVAAAVSQGETAEQVAETLNISVNTVRSHLQTIYGKLKVESKAELISMLSHGIHAPSSDSY